MITENNFKTIDFNEYANSLQSWKDSEKQLWFEGDSSLLLTSMISVVGSRIVTSEGVRRTQKIVQLIVESGFTVVSGLARGVDTVAHDTALKLGGKTIAVMGTPINEVYPKENKKLLEEIFINGLVLSQFKPGTPTQRFNFPKRNDLMAALSELTIVVEAGEGSGTKHQIDSALKYGKVAAFVKSLADSNVKWVQKALEHENAIIVSDEDKFLEYIKTLKANPKTEIEQMSLFENNEK